MRASTAALSPIARCFSPISFDTPASRCGRLTGPGGRARAPRDRCEGHGACVAQAGGLDATFEFSERLARAGYRVEPHLSARLVRDRSHLDAILDRLRAGGITDVFVLAGDPPGAGRRVPRRGRLARGDGPAPGQVRRDRHHGLPGEPPPDLRPGDDPGDVRQGRDGDAHRQPDLLRRRGDYGLGGEGAPARHPPADLDRRARAGSTTESCSECR